MAVRCELSGITKDFGAIDAPHIKLNVNVHVEYNRQKWQNKIKRSVASEGGANLRADRVKCEKSQVEADRWQALG